MKQEKIWRDFVALRPEMQSQVIDLIAFLSTRSTSNEPRKGVKRTALKDESFIGVWRGRKDMRDSTSWVMDIRKGEWMGGRERS